MHIAIRHHLQVYDPADGSMREAEAFILPVRDAQAVMGETVAAYLARVGWRFDLPTVCRINGEYYLRAEWETRALAVNDNVEFVSRPLGSGSGSTGKTIMSIVALVALSAVAGPAGSAIAGALQVPAFAAGAASAAISATIIGSAALSMAQWLTPPAPWWRRRLIAARTSLRSILAVAGRFWSSIR